MLALATLIAMIFVSEADHTPAAARQASTTVAGPREGVHELEAVRLGRAPLAQAPVRVVVLVAGRQPAAPLGPRVRALVHLGQQHVGARLEAAHAWRPS